MIGEHAPTVIMVVGVNGAGKTTSVGKLTRHLVDARAEGAARRGRHLPRRGARAAAAWAERAGPPATAARRPRRDRQPGRRRPGRRDLRCRRRRQGARLRRRHRRHRRAPGDAGAPDGRAEEDPARRSARRRPARRTRCCWSSTATPARTRWRRCRPSTPRSQLTGLVITKLDGTAKGGVLAAIALWSRRERRRCRSTSSASARSSKTCRPSARASSRRRCSAERRPALLERRQLGGDRVELVEPGRGGSARAPRSLRPASSRGRCRRTGRSPGRCDGVAGGSSSPSRAAITTRRRRRSAACGRAAGFLAMLAARPARSAGACRAPPRSSAARSSFQTCSGMSAAFSTRAMRSRRRLQLVARAARSAGGPRPPRSPAR